MENNTTKKIEANSVTVQQIRHLTKDTYVLRMENPGLDYKAGQHILLGLSLGDEAREYSIYNGENDSYVEVLIKEVEEGKVSKKLKKLMPGDQVRIKGPNGFFMMNIRPPHGRKFMFVASGTGISPFHSYVRTFPDADYLVLHGVRTIEEAYEKDDYKDGRYISCVSKEEGGGYFGRITDYLLNAEDLDRERMVYLCGNSNMIIDAIDILTAKGFQHSQIFTEVYF